MALAILLFLTKVALSQWISYPSSGIASLTHYQLPSGYIAACGCVPGSTNYPTAALSQMAYGSSTSYGIFYSWLASSASHLLPLGPACGKCFQLTLLNPVIATPPFKPDVTKSIVVKITDLMPLRKGRLVRRYSPKLPIRNAGAFLNFDLAYPSSSIPDNWFPSNVSLYGYSDFGIWNITYEQVSCTDDWEGGQRQSALGSVPSLGLDACCPIDPTNSSNTCPSYSEQNGIPPITAGANAAVPRHLDLRIGLVLLYIIIYFTL
ncbi:RlpA-like double-psi beta-barrel-protein domain-containing protein-containing protein [Amanita rubescens]|nr:RlpA-like double-psi beta-barrel-protein domain-containing protein-containing protein [Amanita rubescens]